MNPLEKYGHGVPQFSCGLTICSCPWPVPSLSSSSVDPHRWWFQLACPASSLSFRLARHRQSGPQPLSTFSQDGTKKIEGRFTRLFRHSPRRTPLASISPAKSRRAKLRVCYNRSSSHIDQNRRKKNQRPLTLTSSRPNSEDEESERSRTLPVLTEL